ncbi:hypothetical protein [Megasphaera vaginalis (ex Srinivasan et al. 2021)]|uniref:Uncharacterized protein n=1 Tax=Megasphaera vaginalis (ex Srinivasan et al. 2021) TaxID=1111454 RepID=U7ULG5_9FIRM|nr:hypothetical protein [Megasphaera vaginalis (ex Srinivasan et al. 2021)]ERT59343.1 hypothetical protein HMPREF1250_0188 [Megasphaera vaginalis (ex Srinivasan et al. 2021)]
MIFISAQEAITTITDNITIMIPQAAANTDMLKLYIERFVYDVLDYCHRDDFPKTLVYTAVELLGKRLNSTSVAGGEDLPVKSIKHNDTEFVFALNSISDIGNAADADFESIRTKLNLYRKLARSSELRTV